MLWRRAVKRFWIVWAARVLRQGRWLVTGIWLASYILMWSVVIGEGLLLLVLFRQIGLRSLDTVEGISRDGLAIGVTVPPLPLAAPAGVRPDQKSLLVFASNSCKPCQELMPALEEFLREKAERLAGFIVLESEPENGTALGCQNATRVLDAKAMENFRVRVTPFAYLVDQDMRVQAKGLVNHRGHLESLWKQASAQDASDKSGKAQKEEQQWPIK
jgi:thiol-disulfide isomerase/thioredoxin